MELQPWPGGMDGRRSWRESYESVGSTRYLLDSLRVDVPLTVPENSPRGSVPVGPALEMFLSLLKDRVTLDGPLVVRVVVTRTVPHISLLILSHHSHLGEHSPNSVSQVALPLSSSALALTVEKTSGPRTSSQTVLRMGS